MPWSLRILRAFLGVTFVYAGLQKFLDPGFLHAGSPTYIGTQLQGFATATPAAPLMRLLAHIPVVVGLGVALTELAVGIAVLAGIGLITASVIGLTINLILWLSATWHVHPYFLGSDSIYAVAWLALIVGAWKVVATRPTSHVAKAARAEDAGRRAILRGGLVAGMALALGGVANALAGPVPAGSGLDLGGGSTERAHGSTRTTSPSASSPPSSPSTAPRIPGQRIANLNKLPIGQAVGFSAPGVGPAAVVRLANGSVVAYSRVCTHAGCLVGYDTAARLLVCPCHGAEFDPAHQAEPTPGSPTSTPLQMIHVVVDKATGDVILPS